MFAAREVLWHIALVYCWWDWLLIKSYLPIISQSRTSLTVVSTCPVIYFLMSPVWQTTFWRICISHAVILKKFPLFPSEGNVYRPHYPSRLCKEVSWSQISCFSFSQKKSQTPNHVVILIWWWNADTYVRPLESLYCSCFSFHAAQTLWEGPSSMRSNPLLDLHSGLWKSQSVFPG